MLSREEIPQIIKDVEKMLSDELRSRKKKMVHSALDANNKIK